MTQHKHAKEMMQFAKDALETDKPWERWQWYYPVDGVSNWQDCVSEQDMWCKDFKYRRKPEMMRATCADGTVVEWPNPEIEPLEAGQEYWFVESSRQNVDNYIWNGDSTDKTLLESGNLFLHKDDAEQACEALLAVAHGSANWKNKESKVTPDTENDKH